MLESSFSDERKSFFGIFNGFEDVSAIFINFYISDIAFCDVLRAPMCRTLSRKIAVHLF